MDGAPVGTVIPEGFFGSVVILFSGLLSIPILIAANASFVAIEFALVSIRRTRVRELVMKGVGGAKKLEHAVGNLDRYLAATQLGITMASLGLGWLGEPALARLLVGLIQGVAGPTLSVVAAHTVAFTFAFLGIAFFHVVLGELVPRTVALRMADPVALLMVRPLLWFERIFRPVIWIFNRSGMAVVRFLRLKPRRGVAGQVHSVTELHLLMDASEEAGVLERQETDMMHGVLAIGEMTVSQVMVAREDMVSVRASDPIEKIVQTAVESGYSRLPVFDPGGGEVVGVLHAKDLLTLFAEAEQGLIVFQDLLRQPYFVRTEKRVLDILRVFQAGEAHLALVQDEFGEVVGLVTLEDLLEEIVGEIKDEYDSGESPLRLARDGSFIAPGRMSVREVLADLGETPPTELAGYFGDFVRDLAGGVVKPGDAVAWGGLAMTVMETDRTGWPRRVRVVKVPR
jgi:CBS domain containing-hemolysin-like protein